MNEEKIWAKWKDFDQMKVKPNEKRYFLEQILPMYNFKGKILEIGAGACWLSVLLKRNCTGIEAFASDVSKSGLKKGIEVSKSLNTDIDFFIACDCERLPFENGLFDYVLGNAILHHFWNTQMGISEIHRVLINGGLYVGSGELMASRILKYIFGSRFGLPGRRAIKRGIEEKVFTYDQWLNLFYLAGFSQVEIRQNKDFRYKTKNRPVSYCYYLIISGIPKTIIRIFLATDINIVARK